MKEPNKFRLAPGRENQALTVYRLIVEGSSSLLWSVWRQVGSGLIWTVHVCVFNTVALGSSRDLPSSNA